MIQTMFSHRDCLFTKKKSLKRLPFGFSSVVCFASKKNLKDVEGILINLIWIYVTVACRTTSIIVFRANKGRTYETWRWIEPKSFI